MKTAFIFLILGLGLSGRLFAQRACSSFPYQQNELRNNPFLAQKIKDIDSFTYRYTLQTAENAARPSQGIIIRIPVVIHVLYHFPGEMDNITPARVTEQLAILNSCFRMNNADTALIPAIFKPLATDCEIEFVLATSDPRRRNTTGIIKKYSPIIEWQANDYVKFSSLMGDDAWDPNSYLNIWVCNLQQVAGYSSLPGGSLEKDGVVLDFDVFGPNSSVEGLNMGKTLVHEVGHWLNLRHLWGDDYCGDDGVADTPVQGGYNFGCPSGSHITCNNGPYGDMYMNYMDFTNDACINMFTLGQKARMRALFAPGGPRVSMLSSIGLLPPLIYESPIPPESPRWLMPRLYPNPASKELTIDLSYDVRWVGKVLTILNMQGQVAMQVKVSNRIQVIDISRLQQGIYILSAKKEDGDLVQEKFVKL